MYKRIVFWHAKGCYASALNILEEMAGDKYNKVGDRDIFIRRLNNSNYVYREGDYLINWGNGGYLSFPEIINIPAVAINQPFNVNIAANKIKTFKALDRDKVPTLKWTTDIMDAAKWVNEGHSVIGRKTVSGCCGEGIEIYSDALDIQICPLYTLYQKKRHEYRVHVFKDKVIDVVQKRKKNGTPSPTKSMIRNVDDGWVFCHNNLEINDLDRLNNISISAVKACGLDFGAVDVIYNQKLDKYFIVEVNTAPGLESATIVKYAKAFLEDIENEV